MTAFTQTQTGNWNDAATWGGGGYPQTSGDTAALGAGMTATIPVGVSITCGAIAVTTSGGTRTTLQINGTLDLAGNLTMNSGTNLNMGPGSTLDLNGNNVVGAGTMAYNFAGSSGSRVTIISTGSRGDFTAPSNGCVPTITYTDFSGLDDVYLGRCHGGSPGPFASISYSTFNDCGHIDFDSTNVTANSGFLISHCDFRNPYTVAAGKYYPVVYNTASTTTRDRKFEYCTWDSGGLAGNIWVRASNATIDNCVIKGFGINASTGLTISNTIHASTAGVGTGSFVNDITNVTVSDSYIYYADGDHPITANGTVTMQDSVFDNRDGEVGMNWFLWAAGTAVQTVQMRRNIWLGLGVPITVAGVQTNFALDFSRNTVLIDNAGQTGSGLAFATILLTEQSGELTGSALREIYNNLLVDPDTSTGSQDTAVELLLSTTDQVNYLNYNVGWSYPAGAPSPVVKYGSNVNVTTGEGPNDFAANPQFVDRTRNIATWDDTLGGAGSAANAFTELLKLNGYGGSFDADYSVEDLVTWTRAGFVPQAIALDGTGRAGADIGALDVVLAPEITVTAPVVDTLKLVGQSVTVEWSSVSIPGTVNILLSTDNGATYPITLVSGTANDGSYSFTALPAHVSATVKAKVVDASDSDIYDESAAFLIATTDPSGGTNTALWFRLQELAINDGLELSRP